MEIDCVYKIDVKIINFQIHVNNYIKIKKIHKDMVKHIKQVKMIDVIVIEVDYNYRILKIVHENVCFN